MSVCAGGAGDGDDAAQGDADEDRDGGGEDDVEEVAGGAPTRDLSETTVTALPESASPPRPAGSENLPDLVASGLKRPARMASTTLVSSLSGPTASSRE